MSLGVFGGTFNPIHFAHLRLAEEAREALGLARVLFIPSADPPHKKRDLAGASHRLEMVARAIAANPSFEVLTLELERPGRSYTVETLQALRKLYPGRSLWFLMGSDTLAELHTWYEPETLLGLTSIAVASRPGSAGEPLEALIPKGLAEGFRAAAGGLVHRSGTELRSIPFAPLDISASDIRRRIARGASVRYLLPEAIIDYIDKHRLYQPDQEGA